MQIFPIIIIFIAIFSAVDASGGPIINPHPYNYVINHPQACSRKEPKIYLSLMIVSAPTNFARRRHIRRTWGSIAHRQDVIRHFLLGDPRNRTVQERIEAENLAYGDILQEDFADAYLNLTLKSVMLLKWMSEFCAEAEFALKIDDDVFLNPYNLLQALRSVPNASHPLVMGLLLRDMYVTRKRTDKWYVSYEDYPLRTYPPYVAGYFYVLSRGSFRALYEATRRVKPLALEDVYVNGLCAPEAGVALRNVRGIFFPYENRLSLCSVSRGMLILNHVKYHWQYYVMWAVANERGGAEVCSEEEERAEILRRMLVIDRKTFSWKSFVVAYAVAFLLVGFLPWMWLVGRFHLRRALVTT